MQKSEVSRLVTSRYFRYSIVGSIFFLILSSVFYLHLKSYILDYWIHAAAIRDLSNDFSNPGLLYVPTLKEQFLFSPYHLFWALISRILQINSFNTLTIAAGFNLSLFLLAARLFAKNLLGNPKLDALVFLTWASLWILPLNFSTGFNLGHLPNLAMLPSFFSFSLSLVIIFGLWNADFSDLRVVFVVAVSFGFFFITHTITSSFFAGTIAIMVLRQRSDVYRNVLKYSLAVATVLALVSFWPYYSIWGILLDGDGIKNIGGAQEFYQNLPSQTGTAILGFLGIGIVRKDRQALAIFGLLAAFMLVYILNYFVPISGIFSRYLFYIVFWLQCLLLTYMRYQFEYGVSNIKNTLLISVIMFSFLFQSSYLLMRWNGLFLVATNQINPETAIMNRANSDWETIRKWICDDVPVLAQSDIGYGVVSFLNGTVLIGQQNIATIPDYGQRRNAERAFFNPETSVEIRKRIIGEYGMKFILMKKSNPANKAVSQQFNKVFEGRELVLFRVGNDTFSQCTLSN